MNIGPFNSRPLAAAPDFFTEELPRTRLTPAELLAARPDLRAHQFFDVDRSVVHFAEGWLRHEMGLLLPEPPMSILTPLSSRPAFNRMILSSASFGIGEDRFAYVLETQPSGKILVRAFIAGEKIQYKVFSTYAAGDQIELAESYTKPNDASTTSCWYIAALGAFVCAIINEPRIVLERPGGSRQQRRLLQRSGRFGGRWTRISWDISRPAKSRVVNSAIGRAVPLHFRRGHYRRAESHYRGAVQRPDAIRQEDRSLWWQWIEETWVGHPHYGLKLSVHAPRMSLGDVARRRELPA